MKGFNKVYIIFILMFVFSTAGCSHSGLVPADSPKKPVIGVVVYSFDDTWITYVRNQIYKSSEGKTQVDIWDGNNSQSNQNDKIDLFIKRKVNALAVNTVDNKDDSTIIEKAKNANIPLVFFNHEPSAENMQKWDKVYYVGDIAEQSGTMQGQILADYFKKHPTKNAIIRYAMIKGMSGQKGAEMRSQYSVKALEDAGFKTEKVAEDTALWNRSKAQEKMEAFIASFGDNMDCVIANNDDMALGAIDALKAAGYFQNGKYIPVVGVDATEAALNAVSDGTLLGTVLNDAKKQGDAIFSLANILAEGKTPDKDNFGYPITDNKYVWIDYKIITKENIQDAK